jgi:acyl-coenzyme A synthetase/AMP-(fatty) acid ligase
LVHVACSNTELSFLMALGLMRAGTTVSFARETDGFVEHNVPVDTVLFDKPGNRPVKLTAGRSLQLSPDWFQPPTARVKLPEAPDYALVFGSSGSTGRTKLIRVSCSNMDYRIASKFDAPCFAGKIRYLSTAGSTSLTTFADYLITLIKGGLIIRTDRRNGRAVLDASSLYQPTYVSMAPLTLVDVIRSLGRRPRIIRKVDYLRLTGAYCSPSLRRKAADQYAERVLTSYGATEIGRVAMSDPDDTGATPGSVGRIIDGMLVETVGEDGQPLPPGSEGELRIRPPAEAVTSYLGAGQEGPLRDGWFYPGDLGRVDTQANLIFTGRKSAVINLGGNKISPEAAEATLIEMPGVRDIAIAPETSRHGYQTICALVVKNDRNDRVTLDEINAFLSARHERFAVKAMKLVSTIPRTANDKIDRLAVRRLVDGEPAQGASAATPASPASTK